MKASELMIGDLVKVSHLNKVGKIYRLDCANGDKNSFIALLDGDFSYNDIEPIPLTPEILEKNGFIIKKKWAQIGNFGNSPLIVWHFEDDTILHDFKHELEIHQNDTGKVHVKIPCEYVHQLQHALKLCGIDKTIEL